MYLCVKSQNSAYCGFSEATFQNVTNFEPYLARSKTRFFNEDAHQKWPNFQNNISTLNICDMQNFKSLASQELLKIGHIFGSNGKM